MDRAAVIDILHSRRYHGGALAPCSDEGAVRPIHALFLAFFAVAAPGAHPAEG
jgi:hypothetical protein